MVGFELVEMAISTNPKPTIYRNLYENTGPAFRRHLSFYDCHVYTATMDTWSEKSIR